MEPARGPVFYAITASLKDGRAQLEFSTSVPTFDISTHMFDVQAITCAIFDRMAAEVRVQHEDDALTDVPLPKMCATSSRHASITAQELS
jgi:hypothetical protein